MDLDEIKILIEKYWQCETTAQEENILREYFSRDLVPDELKPYAGLFRYYSSVSEMSPPADFSRALSEKRDLIVMRPRPWVRTFSWLYRIAAAVLIVFSMFFLIKHLQYPERESSLVMKDTYEDPEEALAETKRILLTVSGELNKGEREAAKISRFSHAEKLFRRPKSKN